MNKEIETIMEKIRAYNDEVSPDYVSENLSRIEDAIIELAEHPTCETCTHWGKDYTADDVGRRDCESIDNTEDSHIDTRGWVMFRTKPDFYCKLHKLKETRNE